MAGIGGGGYAEKVVLDQRAIARKPPGIDHSHAAAIPLAGQTAWQGLFRHARLEAGQSVLIHGGRVGHFASFCELDCRIEPHGEHSRRPNGPT